jgi:pimeloyl-ACP methyl ester carboxylesterase
LRLAARAAGVAARRGAARRLRRGVAVLLLLVGLGYGFGLALGMNPSTPTDWLLNLPGVPREAGLEAERDTLVVLQHGLWRSAAALGRLQRALEDHGYEVLNPSYPSTRGRIEEHADRLRRRLDEHLAARARPPERIAFVGHSLGGLVIRSYLAGPGAVEAHALVFLGTPQAGARLAALHRDDPLFALLMGDAAAAQLVPGDPIYAALGPVAARHVGVICGGQGDGEGWNPRIPGDDDGTVGVDETRLDRADARVRLPVGHTRLSFDARMIRQVLTFLRHARFDLAEPR